LIHSPAEAGKTEKLLQKGTFFSFEELLILFPLLKKNEALLSNQERTILVKIEKTLYEHLSIAEMENRLGGKTEYA
jgi:hypothetical protein